MKVDEYDYIYEDFEDCGFRFKCGNRGIGNAELVSREELKSIGADKTNHDSIPIVVYCCKCQMYMDYICGKFKWKCHCCGRSVLEDTALRHLASENELYGESDYDEEDEWY